MRRLVAVGRDGVGFWSWVRRRADRGQGSGSTHIPVCERLEPRILLSGDLSTYSLLDPFSQPSDQQAIYMDLHPGPKTATQAESSRALEVLPESHTEPRIDTQAESLAVNPVCEESSQSPQPIAASDLRQRADIQIGVPMEQTSSVASADSLKCVEPECSTVVNPGLLAGEAIQIRAPPAVESSILPADTDTEESGGMWVFYTSGGLHDLTLRVDSGDSPTFRSLTTAAKSRRSM